MGPRVTSLQPHPVLLTTEWQLARSCQRSALVGGHDSSWGSWRDCFSERSGSDLPFKPPEGQTHNLAAAVGS